MVAFIRSLAGASRSGVRMSSMAKPMPRTFRTSAYQLANPKATGSESAVHAEKNDADPETLQKQTANAAQQEKNAGQHHKSTGNDVPTSSEDSVHADRHEHDPLPDHKKKSSS